MTGDRSPIVVGVDGSDSSRAALEWALGEARSAALPVRMICVFSGARTYSTLSMYGGLPVPDLSIVRGAAKEVLAQGVRWAAGFAPDIEVVTSAVDGDVAPVLLAESSSASTVVLGSRRLGALGSVVLGSTGAGVSARAGCPVVVVVHGPAGPPGEDQSVVVGVDGLQSSDAELSYAFAYASRRALPLRAVLCWHPRLLSGMPPPPEQLAPTRVQAWLSEALAGWGQRYPDVSVLATVVRNHPVAGLVAASTGQHLLVVATRSHHALGGTLLGSVSQGVLHHATCPVAVVPTHTHDRNPTRLDFARAD